MVPFTVLQACPTNKRFQGMSPDDVIYLIMPDRFANGDSGNDDPAGSRGLWDRANPRYFHGGDFKGVMRHLDYIKELGATTIWLTPWYDNVARSTCRDDYRDSADYHGYAAVDFYGVEQHFGDLSALQDLVNTAHTAGLKVIQDQVANHTGSCHPWTACPPTPTWYNGTTSRHLDNNWQIWTVAATNPPPDALKSTLEGWFLNTLPDLNQNDSETAQYLIQNSLWWIGVTGVDAIRQDTLPYVPRAYWSRWTSAVKRQYPRLTILGEVWHGDPKLVSFFQGGRRQFDGVDSGVDTLFDFPLFFAIRKAFANGGPMTGLAKVLAEDTNYVNADMLVTFLGLHDNARLLSEPGANVDSLKLAFTFLLSSRGMPAIYYGDEIGMEGGADPDNRRDFPGGWAGDRLDAFSATGRTAKQEEIHSHVKKLLQLRRELTALRRGRQQMLEADADTCAYVRSVGMDSVLVAINKSSQARQVRIHLPASLQTQGLVFSDRLGKLGQFEETMPELDVTLPARTAAILAPRSGSQILPGQSPGGPATAASAHP